MARARPLSEMVAEAYRLADAEGDEPRHPRVDVQRWVNKGLNELYDLLVKARGRDWFRSSATITLVPGTVDYALPADFLLLLTLRNDGGGGLEPYNPAQDAELRDTGVQSSGSPLYYQLRAGFVTLLPTPGTGTLTIDYLPTFTELATPDATFDGVSGWEDYASLYAARRIAIKDENLELAATFAGDMATLAARISSLATKRDAGSPGRIKDVRGQRAHAFARRWR